MARIQPFNAQKLEAACRVLADTERGLTGSEIGYLLQDCKITDVSPDMTKWKRLFNALVEAQNKYQVGNHLIMFINRALDPVNYSREKETTLRGARARADVLRTKLEDRGAHSEIFKYCKSELLEENYFHAVLESIKGVADRIRWLSGLATDGADLVNKAFSVKTPILAINNLLSETELSEQKGFSNILIGIFGAIRNPTAHAPKISWYMTEQDSLDIFSMISFIHRKLDCTKKIGSTK
jgi:uncharacterized protein (TIGR02391 family)